MVSARALSSIVWARRDTSGLRVVSIRLGESRRQSRMGAMRWPAANVARAGGREAGGSHTPAHARMPPRLALTSALIPSLAEDSLSISLTMCTVTHRDGRVTQLDQVRSRPTHSLIAR